MFVRRVKGSQWRKGAVFKFMPGRWPKKLFLILFAAIALAAAGEAAAARSEAAPVQLQVKMPAHMTFQMLRDQVVQTAYSQLGLAYKRGGVSPGSGFDCSGFTRWVFDMIGIKLPRTSREQFSKGLSVSKQDLRPGDMVFFRYGRNVGHVGIYVAEGYFIHSPNRNSEITISNMDSSGWMRNYAGARRLIPD
jgi:cell wall-associated NlpC family hydrolase